MIRRVTRCALVIAIASGTLVGCSIEGNKNPPMLGSYDVQPVTSPQDFQKAVAASKGAKDPAFYNSLNTNENQKALEQGNGETDDIGIDLYDSKDASLLNIKGIWDAGNTAFKDPQQSAGDSISANAAMKGKEREIEITFYTDLASENGGAQNAGKCVLGKIMPGYVACNKLDLKTKIAIPDLYKVVPNIKGLNQINTFLVADTMASDAAARANTVVDIYVPRIAGESDTAYSSRVNGYGRHDLKAYIMS